MEKLRLGGLGKPVVAALALLAVFAAGYAIGLRGGGGGGGGGHGRWGPLNRAWDSPVGYSLTSSSRSNRCPIPVS
ncbi:putative uncharacterized protein [Meiothermus ruber H328]|nr:putative uncharacterized protein [Meiothermus ruber H328]